jgi:hypothetical protein
LLGGWRRGERLRFCYVPGCQHPIPGLGTGRRYSAAQLKAMGDQEALLPPGAPGDRYVGDLLFWQPGLYRVSAYLGGRLIGTVVFGVPAASRSGWRRARPMASEGRRVRPKFPLSAGR